MLAVCTLITHYEKDFNPIAIKTAKTPLATRGESMRGGLPCHIGDRGRSPVKNLGSCGAGEAFFKPVLGQNVRFQT